MALEDDLRRAAKSGKLNYLSVAFTDGGWEATYRGVEDRDCRSTEPRADVVEAICLALTGRKESRKSARPVEPPPVAEPDDEDLLV